MILKGIDTLEFGLDIPNYLVNCGSFLMRFMTLKEAAQKDGKECEINIGGITLKVHRNGAPFYAYRLSCNDFMILFMDRQMKENPPVRVRFMSGYLWSFGYKKAYGIFIKWFLENFHVYSVANRLSRVDISVDSDRIKFIESDVYGIVTRARSKKKHFVSGQYFFGRKFSGFTIGGGGTLMARIYNKTLEIKNSGKAWFCDLWRESGWNEEKEVWRVEFQIRREVLKEFGIYSLEDLLEKENGIWDYLTSKWLIIKQSFGKNVSRWKVKNKWKLVQQANSFYLKGSPLVRESFKQGNVNRLMDQASGALMSVAALTNHKSVDDTITLLKTWTNIKLERKQTSFKEETERRKRKFIVKI
ncbi:MAG: replication initiation factor [Peptococcaceae bacterium]|nr:MAG: replication initiation factor [Peptococcaceae bacterium]